MKVSICFLVHLNFLLNFLSFHLSAPSTSPTPASPSSSVTIAVNGSLVSLSSERLEYNTLAQDDVNLALMKPTWQSSTGYGGVASRAVDGNTNGNWGKPP